MYNNNDYEWNVFINCPFDKQYEPVFHAIIFAVMDSGYIPRSAQESSDSGEVRIQKIVKIIKSCKFAIHDISRTDLSPEKKLPRFNMPLELGIYLGAKYFGDKKQKSKNCLILDTEQFRYQIFLSDLAGQDIRSHNNEPEKAIRCVRDWLSSLHPELQYPGGKEIYNRYKLFLYDLPKICRETKLSIEELTFTDYSRTIYEWLKLNENNH